MTALRLTLPIASLVLSWAVAVAAEPGPVEDMRLALIGTVRMPDGSPAAAATVQWTGDPEGPPVVARTDGTGRFELRAMFGNGAQLHASSADGNHQRQFPEITLGGIRVFCSDRFPVTGIGGPLAGRR